MEIKKNILYYLNVAFFILWSMYMLFTKMVLSGLDTSLIISIGAVAATVLVTAFVYGKIRGLFGFHTVLKTIIEVVFAAGVLGISIGLCYEMAETNIPMHQMIGIIFCMLLAYGTARFFSNFAVFSMIEMALWPVLMSRYQFDIEAMMKIVVIYMAVFVMAMIFYMFRDLIQVQRTGMVLFVLVVVMLVGVNAMMAGAPFEGQEFLDVFLNFEQSFSFEGLDKYYYLGCLCVALVGAIRMWYDKGSYNCIAVFILNIMLLVITCYGVGSEYTYIMIPFFGIVASGIFGINDFGQSLITENASSIENASVIKSGAAFSGGDEGGMPDIITEKNFKEYVKNNKEFNYSAATNGQDEEEKEEPKEEIKERPAVEKQHDVQLTLPKESVEDLKKDTEAANDAKKLTMDNGMYVESTSGSSLFTQAPGEGAAEIAHVISKKKSAMFDYPDVEEEPTEEISDSINAVSTDEAETVSDEAVEPERETERTYSYAYGRVEEEPDEKLFAILSSDTQSDTFKADEKVYQVETAQKEDLDETDILEETLDLFEIRPEFESEESARAESAPETTIKEPEPMAVVELNEAKEEPIAEAADPKVAKPVVEEPVVEEQEEEISAAEEEETVAETAESARAESALETTIKEPEPMAAVELNETKEEEPMAEAAKPAEAESALETTIKEPEPMAAVELNETKEEEPIAEAAEEISEEEELIAEDEPIIIEDEIFEEAIELDDFEIGDFEEVLSDVEEDIEFEEEELPEITEFEDIILQTEEILTETKTESIEEIVSEPVSEEAVADNPVEQTVAEPEKEAIPEGIVTEAVEAVSQAEEPKEIVPKTVAKVIADEYEEKEEYPSFGGFGSEAFETYAESIEKPVGDAETVLTEKLVEEAEAESIEEFAEERTPKEVAADNPIDREDIESQEAISEETITEEVSQAEEPKEIAAKSVAKVTVDEYEEKEEYPSFGTDFGLEDMPEGGEKISAYSFESEKAEEEKENSQEYSSEYSFEEIPSVPEIEAVTGGQAPHAPVIEVESEDTVQTAELDEVAVTVEEPVVEMATEPIAPPKPKKKNYFEDEEDDEFNFPSFDNMFGTDGLDYTVQPKTEEEKVDIEEAFPSFQGGTVMGESAAGDPYFDWSKVDMDAYFEEPGGNKEETVTAVKKSDDQMFEWTPEMIAALEREN